MESGKVGGAVGDEGVSEAEQANQGNDLPWYEYDVDDIPPVDGSDE